MRNESDIKIIKETLDAAAQKGLFGNLASAAAAYASFSNLQAALDDLEAGRSADATYIASLTKQIEDLRTQLESIRQQPQIAE